MDIRQLPVTKTLCRVWIQQYYRNNDKMHWGGGHYEAAAGVISKPRQEQIGHYTIHNLMQPYFLDQTALQGLWEYRFWISNSCIVHPNWAQTSAPSRWA